MGRRPDYYNSNGLVKGLIPAGKPCPFTDVCSSHLNNPNCPTNSSLKKVNFSCAFARACSLIQCREDARENKNKEKV